MAVMRTVLLFMPAIMALPVMVEDGGIDGWMSAISKKRSSQAIPDVAASLQQHAARPGQLGSKKKVDYAAKHYINQDWILDKLRGVTMNNDHEKCKLQRNEPVKLYRILGNDLPPLQQEGQLLKNLQFTLEEEPEFPNVQKVWILNKVMKSEMQDAMERLLELHGYTSEDILKIPLKLLELPTTTDSQVILEHVTNLNQARNLALRDGRVDKHKYKWLFVFDGNNFLTHEAMCSIRQGLEGKEGRQLLEVPMFRLQQEQKKDFITGHSRLADLVAAEQVVESEPQLVFSSDSEETFPEHKSYGHGSKRSLLVKVEKDKQPPGKCEGDNKDQTWCANNGGEGTEHVDLVGYDIRLWSFPEDPRATKDEIIRKSLREQGIKQLVSQVLSKNGPSVVNASVNDLIENLIADSSAGGAGSGNALPSKKEELQTTDVSSPGDKTAVTKDQPSLQQVRNKQSSLNNNEDTAAVNKVNSNNDNAPAVNTVNTNNNDGHAAAVNTAKYKWLNGNAPAVNKANFNSDDDTAAVKKANSNSDDDEDDDDDDAVNKANSDNDGDALAVTKIDSNNKDGDAAAVHKMNSNYGDGDASAVNTKEEPKPAEAAKSIEAPKSVEAAKRVEAPEKEEPKPMEAAKPVEAPEKEEPKPMEAAKPVEATKKEEPRPVEAAKPVEAEHEEELTANSVEDTNEDSRVGSNNKNDDAAAVDEANSNHKDGDSAAMKKANTNNDDAAVAVNKVTSNNDDGAPAVNKGNFNNAGDAPTVIDEANSNNDDDAAAVDNVDMGRLAAISTDKANSNHKDGDAAAVKKANTNNDDAAVAVNKVSSNNDDGAPAVNKGNFNNAGDVPAVNKANTNNNDGDAPAINKVK